MEAAGRRRMAVEFSRDQLDRLKRGSRRMAPSDYLRAIALPLAERENALD